MTPTEMALELRDATGAGLQDCAEALRLHHYDPGKAEIHLRTANHAVVVKGPKPECGFAPCQVRANSIDKKAPNS